jgi:hypothetical protein
MQRRLRSIRSRQLHQKLSNSSASAARTEESLKLRRALRGKHAAEYINAMIETGQREHVDDAASGARALVPSPENEATHTGVHDCCGAHYARLQSHVERGVTQAIIAKRLACSSHRYDLGMSGRIL